MIRFEPVPKPDGFEEAVEQPGAKWLTANPPPKRPRALWAPFTNALGSGFRWLCAYSVMWTPQGTVDHFVSCDEDRSRAYDWTNYRFAAAWINASKHKLRSSRIIDPFEVEDGWFEIILPSLQLVASSSVPPDKLPLVEFVLKRLRLRDDERIIRQRQAYYEIYKAGLPVEELAKYAPLLAAAIRREQQQGANASSA